MKKILAFTLLVCLTASLLTACGGGNGNTPSQNPANSFGASDKPSAENGAANNEGSQTNNAGVSGNISIPGVNMENGWDQARFGDLPQPKNAEFAQYNVNDNKDSEFVGFQISEKDFDQYVKDLATAGYAVTTDETQGDQREVRAHKDGNEVSIFYKPGNGGGTLEFFPFKDNSSELWPRDYMPDVPILKGELYNVEDYGSDGWGMSALYNNIESFKDYIKQCEAAGFVRDPECTEPDYDSDEIEWTAYNAGGDMIYLDAMIDSGDQISINMALKKDAK